MSAQPIACHKCRHVWSFEPPLSRRDLCPKCQADVKVCLNCRHYDQGAHHECREEQAEWVKEKDRGNFCGWFVANATPGGAEGELAKAKAKLDGLFGGAKSSDTPKPGASLGDELKQFLDRKQEGPRKP